jgi:hypothetical protein
LVVRYSLYRVRRGEPRLYGLHVNAVLH